MTSGLGDMWPGRQLLITRRLRERRADLGLTQKQVVTRLARCGVRTTNRALSSLEHGAGLDVAKLPDLAAALDCTVTYLVGLTEDPHRWEPDDGARHTPHADAPSSRTPQRPSRPSSPVSLIISPGIPDRGLHHDMGGDTG